MQAKEKILIREDAEVVCKAWFPASVTGLLTVATLQKEAKELGLDPAAENLKQWSCLGMNF